MRGRDEGLGKSVTIRHTLASRDILVVVVVPVVLRELALRRCSHIEKITFDAS